MRTTRVAFVHHVIPSYRGDLLEAVAEYSDIELVAMSSQPDTKLGFARPSALGYKLHELHPHHIRLWGRSLIWLRGLYSALAAETPDVIVTTGNWSFVSNLTVAAYKLTHSVKVLVLRHGQDYQALPQHQRFLRAAASKLRDGALFDGTILYTHHEARASRRSGESHCVGYLNNTIKTSIVERPAQSGSRVTLACIGRLTEEKRFDLAILAVSCLQQRGVDVELEIIGDGPERAALTNLAHATAVRTRFHGAIYEQDIIQGVLSRAIAVLHPGRVGLSIVEAFAAGCPVITTSRQDHCPEIAYLKDGINGFFVQDADPEAMAEILKELIVRPERREKASRAAQRTARRLTISSAAANFRRAVLKPLSR